MVAPKCARARSQFSGRTAAADGDGDDNYNTRTHKLSRTVGRCRTHGIVMEYWQTPPAEPRLLRPAEMTYLQQKGKLMLRGFSDSSSQVALRRLWLKAKGRRAA